MNSVTEFIRYAKALKDQPLIYGSGGGRGDPGHLTMEYFRMLASRLCTCPIKAMPRSSWAWSADKFRPVSSRLPVFYKTCGTAG